MVDADLLRLELLDFLEFLQHLLVVLIQLAQVDHLEVRHHLRVLLVQEPRERLVGQHRHKQHVEVLKRQPRAILVILVQQAVKVLLTRCSSVLKHYHYEQTGEISPDIEPIE